jgi:Family of unknown function (DUF5701)
MRDVGTEFDRQVENLLAKGYPALACLDEDAFLDHVAPLAERVPESAADGRIAFAIVIRSDLVANASAMRRAGGFVDMNPTEPAAFTTIPAVDVPDGAAYLVLDVDAGGDLLSVTPDDALETIRTRGRSPLTIDEGIAVLTHFPGVLKTRNAFSILGSRRDDRRVPALWVSKGGPRLGWCWAGNPHTWLGSASCAGRVGP